MNRAPYILTRRRFISQAALGAAFLAAPGGFAEALTLTPRQTEGPFYPDYIPLDTDNDLLNVNDTLTSAVGEVTHLSGRILDATGAPIRNALVEIWQCDAKGVYIHSRGGDKTKSDGNFQGFGRFMTSSTGEYYFRTIKPVPYPGRTPHIHFNIRTKGADPFTTQCYIKGHPLNETDGVLRGIRDAAAKESVIVDFAPLPGSAAGESAARFDVVMGVTPTA